MDLGCLSYSIRPIQELDPKILGIMPGENCADGRMPVYVLLVQWGGDEWKGEVVEDLEDLQEALNHPEDLEGPFKTKGALAEHLCRTYHNELVSREHFN